MNKRHHRKKATALPKRQSLSVNQLFRVRVGDGCSYDVIREDVEILIRDFLTRCSQDGTMKACK